MNQTKVASFFSIFISNIFSTVKHELRVYVCVDVRVALCIFLAQNCCTYHALIETKLHAKYFVVRQTENSFLIHILLDTLILIVHSLQSM